MSILESIKGERKMSLNHWRFRILHWAFSVDPNPHVNGLPMFLYTHYCPLFHLTNLIALLSPLILFIKFIVLVVKACCVVLDSIPFDAVAEFFCKLLPKKSERPEKEEPKVTADDERRKCIELICYGVWSNFDSFWSCHIFSLLTKEDVKALFDEYTLKVLAAREQARLRKQKWRERIIFWTNFSRVFIKWAMNLAYISLASFLVYLSIKFASAAWHVVCLFGGFIVWLFTDAVSLETLIFFGKTFFWIGLAWIVVYSLFKLKLVQKFLEAIIDGLDYISPPFYIALVPFRWIKSGWNNTREFISMFYEENCPPINLVSKEEAAVESVARDGEEI